MFSIDAWKERTAPIVGGFAQELSGVRTNRPSAALLEDLKVSYYGQMTPLKQVASVGVQPPRDLVIQAWDGEAVPGIVKAIETSSLHLGASAEGNTIRVKLPELSKERREELVKHIRRLAEDRRIEVRHARDEANKEIERGFREGEITEDQKFKLKGEVQKHIDAEQDRIGNLVAQKEKEVLE